jgi:hypothetical protein
MEQNNQQNQPEQQPQSYVPEVAPETQQMPITNTLVKRWSAKKYYLITALSGLVFPLLWRLFYFPLYLAFHSSSVGATILTIIATVVNLPVSVTETIARKIGLDLYHFPLVGFIIFGLLYVGVFVVMAAFKRKFGIKWLSVIFSVLLILCTVWALRIHFASKLSNIFPSACSTLEYEEQRDDCFQEVAIRRNDISFCTKVTYMTQSCFNRFISAESPISVCDAFHDKNSSNYDEHFTGCIRRLAILKKDTKVCNAIAWDENAHYVFRNECIMSVAMPTSDEDCKNLFPSDADGYTLCKERIR